MTTKQRMQALVNDQLHKAALLGNASQARIIRECANELRRLMRDIDSCAAASDFIPIPNGWVRASLIYKIETGANSILTKPYWFRIHYREIKPSDCFEFATQTERDAALGNLLKMLHFGPAAHQSL